MTNCPIPNDFWHELSSSRPSFTYRDLMTQPVLVQRLKEVLYRYDFRMVEIGEHCSPTCFWFDKIWQRQGSATVSEAYWLIVEPIRRGSYQP